MKKLLLVLLALVLLGAVSGCGNEMDRGKNRNLDKTDMPQSEKTEGEKG